MRKLYTVHGYKYIRHWERSERLDDSILALGPKGSTRTAKREFLDQLATCRWVTNLTVF